MTEKERVFEYDGIRSMNLLRELMCFDDTACKDLSIENTDGTTPSTDELAKMLMYHAYPDKKKNLKEDRFIIKFTPGESTEHWENPLQRVETDSDVDWLIFEYAKKMDESISRVFRRDMVMVGWSSWIDLACEDCGSKSFLVKSMKNNLAKKKGEEEWNPNRVAIVVCPKCEKSRAEIGRYDKLGLPGVAENPG
jgi:hypothetical protein